MQAPFLPNQSTKDAEGFLFQRHSYLKESARKQNVPVLIGAPQPSAESLVGPIHFLTEYPGKPTENVTPDFAAWSRLRRWYKESYEFVETFHTVVIPLPKSELTDELLNAKVGNQGDTWGKKLKQLSESTLKNLGYPNYVNVAVRLRVLDITSKKDDTKTGHNVLCTHGMLSSSGSWVLQVHHMLKNNLVNRVRLFTNVGQGETYYAAAEGDKSLDVLSVYGACSNEYCTALECTRLLMRQAPGLYTAEILTRVLSNVMENLASESKNKGWCVLAHSYGTNITTMALNYLHKKKSTALDNLHCVIMFACSPTPPKGSLQLLALRGLQASGFLFTLQKPGWFLSGALNLAKQVSSKFGEILKQFKLPKPTEEEEQSNLELILDLEKVFENMYKGLNLDMKLIREIINFFGNTKDLKNIQTWTKADDVGNFGPGAYDRALEKPSDSTKDTWPTPEGLMILDAASGSLGRRFHPLYATPASVRVSIVTGFKWMSSVQAHVYKRAGITLHCVVGARDRIVPAGGVLKEGQIASVSTESIQNHQSKGFGGIPLENVHVFRESAHQPHLENPAEVANILNSAFGADKVPEYTRADLEKLFSAPAPSV